MKSLTKGGLLAIVDDYLNGRIDFSAVRAYVFQYYEAEEQFAISRDMEKLFAALAPYLEYEEAFGDEERRERMKLVRVAIGSESADSCLPERAVFALEFPKIKDVTTAYEARRIPHDVFIQQLSRLSPVSFDVARLALWARAHSNLTTMDPERLS
jgi:hypothetical protein